MRVLYTILVLILIGTYVSVLIKVKKNSNGLTPILGWLIGLAFFLMVPLTVITVNDGYIPPRSYEMNNWGDISLSNPNYFRPYILVWLSVMLTCMVAYFFCPTPARNTDNNRDLTVKRLKHAIVVTMVVSSIAWAAMIQMVGGIEAFLLSHWYARVDDLVQRFGTLFILFDHINEANQIAFTAAAALYMSINLRDRKAPWGFTSLILLFLLIEIVMSGNRIFFALYLLAFLVSCWIFNRKKIIVGLLIASPLLAVIFSAWAAVRHDLTNIAESTDTYVNDETTSNRIATVFLGATEGSDVVLLLHMIKDFGGRFDYLYGKTYGRLLTFFLPKSIYPQRPPDFTTLSANLYESGETTSLASTALGEAYANFGIFGILVLPGVTYFACRYTDRLSRSGNTFGLASGAAFIMFVWFARGTFAESLILFLGALLLVWILRLESTPNAMPRISSGLAGASTAIR
jgi:oligosaccharide repeat unit polymerase